MNKALMKFNVGDVVKGCKVTTILNDDGSGYNRAYILKCVACGKSFVKSEKQLNTESIYCDCEKPVVENVDGFEYHIFRDYFLVRGINSGIRYDFAAFDIDSLDTVRNHIKVVSEPSVVEIINKSSIRKKLYDTTNLIYRNHFVYDLRSENIVAVKDDSEYAKLVKLTTKDNKNRTQFNITCRMSDSEGYSHGIVYHVAHLGGFTPTPIDYYYQSDISAARQVFNLETKYCYNEEYNLSAYNEVDDLTLNIGLLYKLLLKEIDISMLIYLRLTDMAVERPLSIFRYGMEDIFKSLCIPCRIHFDLNPYHDKVRDSSGEFTNRINDCYICELLRGKTIGEPDCYRRSIVGSGGNGDFNLSKIRGENLVLTFNEAVKRYGRKTSEYNDKNGVLDKLKTKGYEKCPITNNAKVSSRPDARSFLSSILK